MIIVYKKIMLIYYFLCLSAFLYGQNNVTTSRLTIIGEGETLFFNFNSFEKYKNGITISTIASVYYSDIDTITGLPTSATWDLLVEANDNVIQGDNGNTLPLSTILIEANGASQHNILSLSDDSQKLIESAPQYPSTSFKTTVTLTYHVGTIVPLLGEASDYYFVDIIYTLQSF